VHTPGEQLATRDLQDATRKSRSKAMTRVGTLMNEASHNCRPVAK
jgi:hypothetical protein